MAEIFNKSFATEYERYCATGVYDLGDRTLVDARRAFVGSAQSKKVVEIGSRTGNSTLILAQSILTERLICSEPYPDLLAIARYKFGAATKRELPWDKGIPSDVESFIERQRKATRPYRSLVEFHNASAYELPLQSEEADEVVCPQTFHWLVFETPVSPSDFEYLGKATNEIARVLKPKGLFLFNSNGHVIHFGDEEINDRRIDDYHWTSNTFRSAFNKAFAQIANEEGLPYQHIGHKDPSDLEGLFNLDNLRDTLEGSGLKILEQPDGRLYRISFWYYGLQEMLNSLRAGPLMTHFSQPGLVDLPEEKKGELIDSAIKRTLAQDPKISAKSYYETFFSFVAQKQ